MNKRNNGTRLLLLLLAALFALTAFGCKKAEAPAAEPAVEQTAEPAEQPAEEAAEQKSISVLITFPDGTEKAVEVQTTAEMLGEALQAEGLIEGTVEQYGLFVTAVDGVAADASKNEYWVFTKGGEWVTTGADLTPIADGDAFEFFIYK